MVKTLIVPGYKGSGEGHWQRHWAATDPTAVLVRQDDWFSPCLESWLQRLLEYCHRYPGARVVAHSLGVVLVAHAARLHPHIPISAALLVAPADVDTRVHDHACFATFVPAPRAPLPFPAIVAASRNDPYIAFERSRLYARLWEAELVDLGPAGHVNIDSGHGPWPAGRDLLRAAVRKRAGALPPRGQAKPSARAISASNSSIPST